MKISIIGGGLSGLTNAILLNRLGYSVRVYERKSYPFHRVCGEYISNEVLPLIKHLGINPYELGASNISRLRISDSKGNILNANLDLGGFGISRYQLDNALYIKAKEKGVEFLLSEKVNDIKFNQDRFYIQSSSSEYECDYVIASYGKRSTLDTTLDRSFIKHRSPYIGVKYHIKTDFPSDLIQLDNFHKGYCGLVKIEEDKYCLCYLSHRDNLKMFKNIQLMEENVLMKNPHLKNHLKTAEFLFDEPEVINEISFEKKTLLENHILFCGDAAGMITPLCGNGMAMGMHTAYLLYGIFKNHGNDRALIEKKYIAEWGKLFSKRLFWGRVIQNVFNHERAMHLSISILKNSSALQRKFISITHGKTIKI